MPAVQRRARREDRVAAGRGGDALGRGLSRPGSPIGALFDIEEHTTIALDDEVEAASNALSTAARVSVTLRDGRTLARLVRAPKGSAGDPFTGAEHEARFTQELSRRVPERVCAEIVAMSKDLDNLDPRRLTRVLAEDPTAGG